MWRPRIVGLVILAGVLVGGCTVSLRTRTEPAGACPLMAIGGVLRTDFNWGLGVEGGGKLFGVVWPYGYTARRDADGVALVDRDGRRIAKEGDSIMMAGTIGSDGVLHPCDPPDLRILSTTP